MLKKNLINKEHMVTFNALIINVTTRKTESLITYTILTYVDCTHLWSHACICILIAAFISPSFLMEKPNSKAFA